MLIKTTIIMPACTPPVQVTVTVGPPTVEAEDPSSLDASSSGVESFAAREEKASFQHTEADAEREQRYHPLAARLVVAANDMSASAAQVKPPSDASTSRPEKDVVPHADRPADRIVIESIHLDAPIIPIGWVASVKGVGSEWESAEHAVGFHADSAFPGQRGNTVLSGHHNIHGEVFRQLHQVQPGDMVVLFVGEREYRYLIEDIFIVPERGVSDEQRRQNAAWIAPTTDARLTMVTCWPANDNSHRVIVIARPATGP